MEQSNDIVDEHEFNMWAEMVRSDQMTQQQIHWFLEDHPEFAKWYYNKYIK